MRPQSLFLCVSALFAGTLFAQDFNELRVEKFSGGYTFTEGPVWAKEGYLVWSDVPNNRIWKAIPGDKPAIFREPSNRTNGNDYDGRGNFYHCEGGAHRVTKTDRKGAVTVVAGSYQGKRFNAPNDIIVRKDGHVYFTDPAFGSSQEEGRQLDFFGIYHVTPKGEVELVAKPKGRPNGIALSPNGKVLYVDNSDERNVYAYDLDGKGAASNERVLVSSIKGVPDGMAVDEKGNLYVTADAVEVYSPEGKHLHTIELPEIPRNVAFGDPDLQTLFVTAYTSVYRIRMNVKGSVQY